MRHLFSAFAAILLASCGGDDEETTANNLTNLSIEEKGKRAFRVCAACHSVKNPAAGSSPRLVGPPLWGILGKPAGTNDKFAYSQALLASEITWTPEEISAFIENPQARIRGNRMSFAGEKSPEKRQAIVAYLMTLK